MTKEQYEAEMRWLEGSWKRGLKSKQKLTKLLREEERYETERLWNELYVTMEA